MEIFLWAFFFSTRPVGLAHEVPHAKRLFVKRAQDLRLGPKFEHYYNRICKLISYSVAVEIQVVLDIAQEHVPQHCTHIQISSIQ